MYEKIISMTPDELDILNGLIPVAEEARKLSKLIQSTYLFKMNEDQKIIYENKGNYIYITHDGFWSYVEKDHNPDRALSFSTAPEGIFLILRDEFLLENGYSIEMTTYRSWPVVERFRKLVNIVKKYRSNKSYKNVCEK